MYETQDEPRALAIVTPPRVQLDQQKLLVLKATIAPGLTGPELAFFGNVCQRMQLDPFARQIYAIKRGDKLTIQVGIDGFRALAERTGLYRGQLGPLWCGADGAWVDVWLSDDAPVAAKVGVLRAGFDQPIWAVARTKAYRQESNALWRTMPDVLIAKCAEALALRRTFPDALGGAYEPSEMDQAGPSTSHVDIMDEAEYAASQRAAESTTKAAPKPTKAAPAPAAPAPSPAEVHTQPAHDQDTRAKFAALRERARAAGIRDDDDWPIVCEQKAGTADPLRMRPPGYRNLVRYIESLEATKAQAEAKLALRNDGSDDDVTAADLPSPDNDYDLTKLPTGAIRP